MKATTRWGLYASVLAVLLAAFAWRGLQRRSQRGACRDNLAIIAGAIESTVLELPLYEGDSVPVEHIVLFMKGAALPRCPSGGEYGIPRVGGVPSCSVHGNILTGEGWTWGKWQGGRPPNRYGVSVSEAVRDVLPCDRCVDALLPRRAYASDFGGVCSLHRDTLDCSDATDGFPSCTGWDVGAVLCWARRSSFVATSPVGLCHLA